VRVRDALHHVAIRCGDVTAKCAQLKADGFTIKVEPRRGHMPVIVAFVSDPDGFTLELVQPLLDAAA